MLKEEEKLLEYRDLATDFQQMYGTPVSVMPVVMGYTSVVSSRCMDDIKKIPPSRLFTNLQK